MPPSSEPVAAFDSVQLYRACRHGDAAAQAVAYRTLWRYLFTIAYQIMRRQPEPEALAQDCAQLALVRIHQRLIECQEPAAFKSWARRIVSNLAIDELRRRRRVAPGALDATGDNPLDALAASAREQPERTVLAAMSLADLHTLLNQAPISPRSHRVVVGRYLDDAPDETLAQTESQLAQAEVLPSHIQVTRSKNLSKLRTWGPLCAYLTVATG